MTRSNIRINNDINCNHLTDVETYKVINLKKILQSGIYDPKSSTDLIDQSHIDLVEIYNTKKLCILSYRWSDGTLENLLSACRRAATWDFEYALCDVITIDQKNRTSEAILKFNKLYEYIPVVHYYPSALADTRRIWIASEVYKSYKQSGNILNMIISDKIDNESIFINYEKINMLLNFFETHEHNNSFHESGIGDTHCSCFDKQDKLFKYVDRRNSSCLGKRHFESFFVERLNENIRTIACRDSLSSIPATEESRIAHLIEGILNSDGDDFAGTIPFDVLYIMRELVPDIIELNEEELSILDSEKHSCLASKITATFILLIIHGALTAGSTNLLSSLPIKSEWMLFIANLILAGGEEKDSPSICKDKFLNWFIRRIHVTFTGCVFDCHIIEPSDHILSPETYYMKIIPEAAYLHTALRALKDTLFCNCVGIQENQTGRVVILDRFESAIAHVRSLQGKDFSVQPTGALPQGD